MGAIHTTLLVPSLALVLMASGGLVEQADDRTAVQQLYPRRRSYEEGLDRHVPQVQASRGGEKRHRLGE